MSKPGKTSPPHTTVRKATSQTADEVLAYWTEERMRDAIPLPPPDVAWDPDRHPEQLTPDGRPVRQPVLIPPGLPTPPEVPGVPLPQQTGTPVPNPGGWPYSAIGKLFMTMNGQNYVGSGFSVSGSTSVFMTAGHCVYDQGSGQWATNVMIALSYTPTSPGAQFAAVTLVTLVGWINKQGRAYDIGAGVVNGNMFNGRGNMGLLFNQAANTGPWTAVGYPAAAPYPGNAMYQTVGSYIGAGDPGTIGMNNNDMGGGSSGGPWIVNSNWGYVNGLQSYDYGNPDTDEYSPYFGVGAYNVWLCAVAGQCGSSVDR